MEQKYRMLEVGEILRKDDEVNLGTESWIPYGSEGGKINLKGNINPVGYYRRPIPTEKTPDEVSELKQKLSVAEQQWMNWEKSWFDQRAKLADAQNQITDLTRRLEDALSDKVIAEKSLKNLDRSRKDATLRKSAYQNLLDIENHDDAKQIILNLERKVTALQKDLDRSRKDLMSETDFGLRSRVKLTDERDKAIAEVERLRQDLSEKTHVWLQTSEEWEDVRVTLRMLKKI